MRLLGRIVLALLCALMAAPGGGGGAASAVAAPRTRAFVPAISVSSSAATATPGPPLGTPVPPPPGDGIRVLRLPKHFAIGLSAQPDETGLYGWLPESGVPWDYAYQYLAGGVNTPGGWRHWNERGQFPLFYARGAAERGYIPVLTYYQLQHSRGPCDGCGESAKDLANLDDAATMAAYFEDFALLMKRLGPGTWDGVAGFGGTAVVHVEPDLSGFAMQAVLENGRCAGHCSGQGNDPALLRAAVARSGAADVAAYPDTFQGFNWALLHLRDLYAPNVLLAFHVSGWATLQDVGSSTDPGLDAAGLGAAAGRFAALSGTRQVPAGTSTYDLVFNDVSDRDSGYKKYVLGHENAFWDRLNVAFPNFHRWELYLAAALREAGRPGIVWQVPIGNQVYRSMENTDGHYQDNRAEYFFEHVDELVETGVVAVMFGTGNAGSTVYQDGKRDGVTNPAPRCSRDGFSSGERCPERASTVADDDGGYLREAAARYYQTPRSLP
jgi:hypothetical protein